MISFSWSKVVMGGWCLALAAISTQFTQFVQGLVALIIGAISLTSSHGDALLIMPLLFLSERCLDETHAHGHSPLLFYASAMLSYMQSSVPSGERNTQKGVTNELVMGLAGAGSLFFLTKDVVLAGGFAAYVVGGLVVFLMCRRALGVREAIVVSSLAGWLLCEAVANSNINTETAGRLTATTIPNLGARAALLSALLSSMVLFALPFHPKSRAGRSLTFLAVVGIIIATQYMMFNYITGKDAFAWILDFCLSYGSIRPYILMGWASGIPLVTVVISLFGGQLALLEKRKLFHFLSVAAFAPVIVLDPDFFHVAIAVAVALSILVEANRVYGGWGSKATTNFLSHHIDHRDATLIRTHIYLMLAMGISLIMRGRRQMLMARSLPPQVDLALFLLPGVFSLGIADAFAAIVGRRFGKLKWSALLCGSMFPLSKNHAMGHKSPAGTAGAIVSCTVLWTVLVFLLGVVDVSLHWAPYAAIVGIAVMETVVEGIDNLELPLMGLGLVHTFVVVQKFVEVYVGSA